jgi:DNA-binding NarL/FixJ family response regulator
MTVFDSVPGGIPDADGIRRRGHLRAVEDDFRLRVLLVDDDEFARSVLGDALSLNADVMTAASVAEALAEIDSFDPHAVVTDLDLGNGPNGAELLDLLAERRPWIGRIVLSAHASHILAVGRGNRIPEGSIYLVKSDLKSVNEVYEAILLAIDTSRSAPEPASVVADGRIPVTEKQAAILRLVALGMSTTAIARELDISDKAAETAIEKALDALGVTSDDSVNPWIAAAMLMRSGRVYVKC